MPDVFCETRGCDYLGGEWTLEVSWASDFEFSGLRLDRWRHYSNGYCRMHIARRLASRCRKAAKGDDGDAVLVELNSSLGWRDTRGCSGGLCDRRRVEMRWHRGGERDGNPVGEIVRGLCLYHGARYQGEL